MKALLLVAHGSRDAEANAELLRLSQRIAKQVPLFAPAFLELAPPSVEDSVAELVSAGATQIAVLPCFLAGGHHVARDIPRQINRARARHPRVEFEIRPHIGARADMEELILAAAGEQPGFFP